MEVKIEQINLLRKTIVSLNKHLGKFEPQNLDDNELDDAINLLIDIEDDENDTNTVPTVSTVHNSQQTFEPANLDESNQQQKNDSKGEKKRLRSRTYSIDEVGFIEKDFSGNHQFTLNVNIV